MDADNCRLLGAHPWKWPSEHINVKEARVALLGLRWVARMARNCGRRFLTLSDSLVTIGVFEKGRSSRSPVLMALCRRAAAYQLG